MFELRLGLALGKSLAEVRAMPYPEYREWQLFSRIEPFGWHDREYRTAAVLSMLHNAAVEKKDQKPVEYFIRNMPESLLGHIKREKEAVRYDLETEEGRRLATERAVRNLKRMFPTEDKR